MEKEWVELDTTSCRLSITMRRTTYETIQLDLNKFGYNNKGDKMTLSGFLNVVFSNHHRYLKDYRVYFNNLLKEKANSLKIDKSKIRLLSEYIIEEYGKSEFAPSFKKSGTTINFKFLLNKENIHTINLLSEKINDLYKGKIVSFIREVFYSYISLSAIDREKVFYQDIINKINESIKNSRVLLILLKDGTHKRINPYQLISNTLKQTNELFGIENPINNSNPIKKDNTITIRLADIKKIDFYEDSFIKEKNIVPSQSPTYETDELIDVVKIQLTVQGVIQFNRQFEYRPSYEPQKCEDANKRIFTFKKVSKNHILYYFLNFGSNVKVLEPIELANKFKNIHKFAYEQY